VAPASAAVGEAVKIRLDVWVWGAGGPVKGRYTELVLFYRLVGDEAFAAVMPQKISEDATREVFDFTIPSIPASKAGAGEIEYYIELKLDGQKSRIAGVHRITVTRPL